MENKKRVLICDDEEGVRESLSLILSERYNVSFAENSLKAMDYLKTNPDTDLILLDIKMPKMNGLEALKNIKKKYPYINIVIVTGYQSAEIASTAVHGGAKGYIVKPFQREQILKTVQDIIGK